MVENMPPKLVRFLLSFAVPAKDRKKRFTEKMEKGAILCFAELERKKGKGRILKRTTEEIAFIAQACYPTWLVPWKRGTLIFDGLGIMAHTFSYATLPDVRTFITNIDGDSMNHEAYLAFLSSNLNYFQGFTREEGKTVKGLVTSPDFVGDFASYLSSAKKINGSAPNKILLSPTMDEAEASISIKEISSLRTRLTQDIADLHGVMRLLNSTAERYVKSFEKEIGKVRKEFDKRIEVLKPSVMKKIRKIQKEYDKKISLYSGDIGGQLHLLHQEYIKLEKEKERKSENINRCEVEIKSCRLRKDGAGELRWRQDIENYRREISALDKKLKDVQQKVKDTESMKKDEISKIRAKCDKEVDKIMDDVRNVEASRDAKIHIMQKEMESLQDMTSQVVEQINKLVKLKRQTISNLDQVGLAKKRRTYALTYIPFYLICYQAGPKRRYVIYPPSIAGSMGILTKFKGVFGVAKTKSLLQFRSGPITSLISQIIMLLEKNPVFEKEMYDAGTESNILRTNELKEHLRQGLRELKDEGWISESELEVFTAPLAKVQMRQ